MHGHTEQALAHLKTQCQTVEEAIAHLGRCKKQADDHAYKAKEEVREGIECILEQLRQRELKLLRLIDLVHNSYGNAFHMKYASLCQILGTLKHTMMLTECGHQVSAFPFTKDNEHFGEEVRRLRSLPNTMDYRGNATDICQLIQNFGNVSGIPSYFYQHPSEELQSESLPSKLEEYEDDEHHVLYKTLEGLQLGVNTKQSTIDEWLKPAENAISSKLFQLPGYLTQADVSFWLKDSLRESRLKASKACSEASRTSFEVIDGQSDGDSLEQLDNYSSNILTQMNVSHLSSPLSSPKSSCKDGRSCCSVSSPVDIENLGMWNCGIGGDFSYHDNVSTWLAKERSNDSLNTLLKSHVKMEEVCVANECCADFGQCVSKDRCVAKAFDILDKSDWLKSPNVKCENWLKRVKNDGFYSEEKMDYSEKSLEGDSDSCKWYRPSINDNGNSNLNKNLVIDNVVWLVANSVVDNTPSFIRKDFEIYFKNDDSTNWLTSH